MDEDASSEFIIYNFCLTFCLIKYKSERKAEYDKNSYLTVNSVRLHAFLHSAFSRGNFANQVKLGDKTKYWQVCFSCHHPLPSRY